MVLIQQGDMREQVQNSISLKEEDNGKEVLLSRVVEANNIDPLLFYSSGKRYFKGERTFWSNPSNSTILVGLGRAYEIDVTSSIDRFGEVESQWKKIMNDMNKSFLYGTGPILFGGFSFDPKRSKTALWNDFSDAKFILPKLLLSVIDGKCFFTFNVLGVNPKEEHLEELEALKDKVLQDINVVNVDTNQKNCVKSEVDPKRWMNSVEDVTNEIKNGKLEKVVLAREIKLHFGEEIQNEEVLMNLTEQQPMSYLFAFENNDTCFIGASPERLVKKRENQIKSTCLAGSIARGRTLKEDSELGKQLLTDQKNLIEHDVVVSMIKEAMLESCESIVSAEEPQLFKMRDIQHLYTPIQGKAKDGVTLFSMVKKLHPTPALGGFPSEKALEKIREVELLERGWYASPIGWIDGQDNGEFAVAIRSGLLYGRVASLFAGCGIVAESQPESEYNETNIKFKPMLSALGGLINENN